MSYQIRVFCQRLIINLKTLLFKIGTEVDAINCSHVFMAVDRDHITSRLIYDNKIQGFQ